MADRRIWDKKTNEKRNEKTHALRFNMNKAEDVELHKKFLRIKENYGTSDSQTLKNLIMEKDL